jgi:hypothetical protein
MSLLSKTIVLRCYSPAGLLRIKRGLYMHLAEDEPAKYSPTNTLLTIRLDGVRIVSCSQGEAYIMMSRDEHHITGATSQMLSLTVLWQVQSEYTLSSEFPNSR